VCVCVCVCGRVKHIPCIEDELNDLILHFKQNDEKREVEAQRVADHKFKEQKKTKARRQRDSKRRSNLARMRAIVKIQALVRSNSSRH
jgi:hypothetical protein